MSSRPKNLLFRHFASRVTENKHPILVMEREGAQRALRLLRAGGDLRLHATIELDRGYAYKSRNVIGEIRGSRNPEEIDHAESDTFDKVDQPQLKQNAAIAAALIWGFANGSEKLPRQSHAEIAQLIDTTDLEQQMRNFAVWQGWESGERGRHEQD